MEIKIAHAIIITLCSFVILGFVVSYGEYRRLVRKEKKFNKEIKAEMDK